VEKCGTAGEATDDRKIRRMRFARWITKAKGTHSPYSPFNSSYFSSFSSSSSGIAFLGGLQPHRTHGRDFFFSPVISNQSTWVLYELMC